MPLDLSLKTNLPVLQQASNSQALLTITHTYSQNYAECGLLDRLQASAAGAKQQDFKLGTQHLMQSCKLTDLLQAFIRRYNNQHGGLVDTGSAGGLSLASASIVCTGPNVPVPMTGSTALAAYANTFQGVSFSQDTDPDGEVFDLNKTFSLRALHGCNSCGVACSCTLFGL